VWKYPSHRRRGLTRRPSPSEKNVFFLLEMECFGEF